MNKLVLHHTYRSGVACDVTQSSNHGASSNIKVAGAPYEGIYCEGPQSGVLVQPSPTLTDMRAVRVVVSMLLPSSSSNKTGRESNLLFHLDNIGGVTINRVTGALTASLTGDDNTAYVPLGQAFKPVGFVPKDNGGATGWHEVELRNNGVGHAEIRLDGKTLAETYKAPAVTSLGKFGMVIGGVPSMTEWFGGADFHGFGGFIREVRVWALDPVRLFDCVFDYQNVDMKSVRDIYTSMVDEGVTAASLRQNLKEVLDAIGYAGRELTAHGPAVVKPTDDAMREAFEAYAAGDVQKFASAGNKGHAIGQQVFTAQQGDAITKKLATAFGNLPKTLLEKDNIRRLVKAFGGKMAG